MYFSKIALRRNAPPQAVRRVLSDGYQPHVVLWDIMSGGRTTMERNFIYRLEANEGRPFFYVVSEQPPANDQGIWDIAAKPYDPIIREGDSYSFALRANPVRTPSKRETTRKRLDVILEARLQLQREGVPRDRWPTGMQLVQEHASLWLQQREESCGFSLAISVERTPVLVVESYLRQKFFKNGNNKPVTLSIVDFRGVLKVTEPDLFREKLFNGISRGKAFGCGLMLIRRAN